MIIYEMIGDDYMGDAHCPGCTLSKFKSLDKYFLPHSHAVAQRAKLLFDIWLREDLTPAQGGRTVILTKGEEEEEGEVGGVEKHGSCSSLQLQLVSSSGSSSSSGGAPWLFFQSL